MFTLIGATVQSSTNQLILWSADLSGKSSKRDHSSSFNIKFSELMRPVLWHLNDKFFFKKRKCWICRFFFLLQSCQVDGTAHVVQLYNWTLQHKTCHQSFGSMQICGLMAFTSAEGVTLRSANVRSTCTRLMNLQSLLEAYSSGNAAPHHVEWISHSGRYSFAYRKFFKLRLN